MSTNTVTLQLGDAPILGIPTFVATGNEHRRQILRETTGTAPGQRIAIRSPFGADPEGWVSYYEWTVKRLRSPASFQRYMDGGWQDLGGLRVGAWLMVYAASVAPGACPCGRPSAGSPSTNLCARCLLGGRP